MISPTQLRALIDLHNPWIILGAIGTALWLAAYVLVIVKGFKHKTYAIPLGAVALNFSWETIFSFILIDPVWLWELMDVAWWLFDTTIVYQLVRYGRAQQTIPEVKKRFHLIFAAALGFGFAWQYTFSMTYDDELGLTIAFMINVVMSLLFINMQLLRHDKDGYMWGVGWTKLFGTLAMSIMCHHIMPIIYPHQTYWIYMDVLYVTILALDIVYVAMLWSARRGGVLQPAAA